MQSPEPASPTRREPALTLSEALQQEVRSHPVVLFDGLCNLCNASVNFIIERDHGGAVRFAPLQSQVGSALVTQCGSDPQELSSVVLIEGGRCYTRSTAALRIVRHLRNPWPVLRVLLIVPRPLRNAVYDIIARNRLRWFGKREACRVPTPEERGRFLAYDAPAA